MENKHVLNYKLVHDGTVYEGEFINDKANGKGKMFFSNGDKYEGNFINNIASGYGKYTKVDGSYYEG